MRTQKRAIAYLPNAILIASMLILPALTFAQELNTSSTRRSWGYAFAGAHREERYRLVSFTPYVVEVDSTVQFSRAGVGWEWLTFKGLAIGVEGAGRSGRAESSFNVSYHFKDLPGISRTIVPFATVGGTVSWGIGDGGLALGEGDYNVGGGVSLWLNRHLGPRFEIRKYGDGLNRGAGVELRVGVTFR
jgi:hypothetical protein